MLNQDWKYKTHEELQQELQEMRIQLEEANETIEAIRTGQVDALVVRGADGNELYTLKSADQTYRVFIEKMTEGAVTLNHEGIILYCNTQFATMVEYPLSTVIGQPFEKFIAENHRDSYQKIFEACWLHDCKGEVLLIAGKSKTPVQLSLTTLDLEQGVSLSIILTDLTAQKQTQQQLRENNEQLEISNKALESSNHDLQQFASVASHDLQEPLRKIQVFSNFLKDRQSDLTPESKKFLEKIIGSAIRMRNLINDVLTYSGLSATNHKIDLVELDKIVKEVTEDFELIIEEKNADIIVSGLPTVKGNFGQLRQVFHNLLSNSLKFTRKDNKPRITISAKNIVEKAFDSTEDKDGAFSLISITDNGIGFDEKYVSNIFALFERLHSKDKYEGTGIGLAIAKKIIEKHNGLISATSDGATGTVFKFILPVTQSYSKKKEN